MFFLVKPSLGDYDFMSANHVNFYSLNKLSNLKKLYDYTIFHFEEEIRQLRKGIKGLNKAIDNAKRSGETEDRKKFEKEHQASREYIKIIEQNYIPKLKKQYEEIENKDFSVNLRKEVNYIQYANNELSKKINSINKERSFLEKNINPNIKHEGKNLTFLNFLYINYKF